MKLLSILALPLLAAQTYGVYIACTGSTDDAFREPDYDGGIMNVMNAAGSRGPNSYTTTNQTWLSQGYYSWALTAPRGAKALSSQICSCMDQMKANMQSQKAVCLCQFGPKNQSAIGVGKIPKPTNQKREYEEPTNLAAFMKRGAKKPSKKGVGPVKMPQCASANV